MKSPKFGAGWEAGKPHKHLKAVKEKSQYIVSSEQMVPQARNIKKVKRTTRSYGEK